MEEKSQKVLCVGLCCLDIVMFCKSYPVEDSDQRCVSHEWRRGGNASNNATVFSEFNIPCEILGTISTDIGGQFMKNDFKSHGISSENCMLYKEYESPVSTVWINVENGSRTIVHSNKNMPEVSIKQFLNIKLDEYGWILFECRPHVEDIKLMIKHIRDWNSLTTGRKIKISIEIEKPKPELMDMLSLGDFIFISKDFASACGFSDKDSAVRGLYKNMCKGAHLVCAWGDKGAALASWYGRFWSFPAYPPTKMLSTLGAGDTFLATAIVALRKGKPPHEAMELACRVAGAKCGLAGVKGLAEMFPDLCDK